MMGKLYSGLKSAIYNRLVLIYIILKTMVDYFYDFSRYLKYSSSLSISNESKMEGRIIAHYHVIEKGLSYENPRPGFGQPVVSKLIDLLEGFSKNNFSKNNVHYKSAVAVLQEYLEFHKKIEYNLNDLEKKILRVIKSPDFGSGGIIELNSAELFKHNFDFKQFAFSRHTIRNFIDKDVDMSLIDEAISIAQKSPSACNRQSTRVYVVSNKNKIRKHLSYQSGNRGFGDKINKLLIITSDVSPFEGSKERNQCYVDAGFFSMSLLYAIHYLKLGAVTLNWSVSKKDDLNYRKFSNIKNSENIVLMIGVGHIPNKLKVPLSKRHNLDKVVKYL